jgi:hypothetical protein
MALPKVKIIVIIIIIIYNIHTYVAMQAISNYVL